MFRIGHLHIVSYRKLLDTKSHVNKICQNITKKNMFPLHVVYVFEFMQQ